MDKEKGEAKGEDFALEVSGFQEACRRDVGPGVMSQQRVGMGEFAERREAKLLPSRKQ